MSDHVLQILDATLVDAFTLRVVPALAPFVARSGAIGVTITIDAAGSVHVVPDVDCAVTIVVGDEYKRFASVSEHDELLKRRPIHT